MMEMLVKVQAERRIRQPLAASLKDVVRHVVVAHPCEIDIGESLGDALHHAILHGHRAIVAMHLSRKILDQSCSVTYKMVSRCPLLCSVYRSLLVILLCGRNCTPAPTKDDKAPTA